MAVTPLLMILNEHVIQSFFIRVQNIPDDTIEEKDNQIIIAGFGRFGVIVGRLLMAGGFSKVTFLDNDPSHIDTLRKFGFKVYYGDASRTDLLEAAGIAQAKILVLTLNDYDKITQIAAYVKRKYPHIKISARAKDIAHAYELSKFNVNHIKQEVAYSAMELGITALKELGFTSFQAHRAAKIFKYHNQEVKKDLFSYWEGDRKHYINEVKRHAAELEDILRAETEQSIHESDKAWDVDSLRDEVIEIYGGENNERSG
jgi:voltage-gated potassium channel Kch